MLHCELFTADKYQDVQGFHCGDEPWSVEVNEFINGENGHSQALKLLAEKRIEMWLYRLDNEKKVVGFGALSKPRDWEIDGIKHRTTTIYAFGVQTEFKGLPSGPSNERYSSLILSDLLDKATKYGRPLCGLFVHKENLRAKTFYEREGFVQLDEPRNTHDRMALWLTSPEAKTDASK